MDAEEVRDAQVSPAAVPTENRDPAADQSHRVPRLLGHVHAQTASQDDAEDEANDDGDEVVAANTSRGPACDLPRQSRGGAHQEHCGEPHEAVQRLVDPRTRCTPVPSAGHTHKAYCRRLPAGELTAARWLEPGCGPSQKSSSVVAPLCRMPASAWLRRVGLEDMAARTRAMSSSSPKRGGPE